AGGGRSAFRNHQMLVIAMSNRHAAAILDFIRRRFPDFSSDRIGQDVGIYDRNRRLVDYRDGELDVMVQVDMIGEGTDIKSISTIVKADLVRAHSKTMQQVFRGMRYLDEWPEAANHCDIYAANDSDLVHTLDRIMAEEQIGVKIRAKKSNQAPPGRGEQQVSPWELAGVEHRTLRTHSVDFHHKAPPRRVDEPASQVTDVNEKEKELRKECAALASELAFTLQSAGRSVEIRTIHAEAKKRFSKAQQDLSIRELTQKRDWLEKCLRLRRLT
ncbi:MAG: helicase-related protein, partial [Rhodothermales bacterium]